MNDSAFCTLLSILFDKCNKDQLIQLGYDCGINLSTSVSFDLNNKILALARGRAEAL